jgi:hydrogenase/urease accessory protein HupE
MSGLTHLRLAAFCALAYGLLLVSGVLHHFQRTGSLRALVRGLSQPWLWVALLIALLVMYGLWRRYAWAWWLGILAAGFQVFRILSPYVMAGGARLPPASTLVALVLLLLVIVLLLPRKARLASSR